MSKVVDLAALEILDSRGNPILQAWMNPASGATGVEAVRSVW